MISTHLFAHHVRLSGGSKTSMKFAYVHTPARYIWAPELDSRGRSLPVRMLSVPLRRLDASRAKELTKVAANSEFVSRRIETTWERESTVIYPPVAVERIKSVERWRDHLNVDEEKVVDGLPDEFVLGASRLVMYKMLDHVIRVGKRAQLPVVIVGDGPDLPRLKTIANEEKIECYFVGGVSDRLLYSLFQSCSVYVFPPVEDFGIIPVEAMAAGAPVIANRRGGASESVVHGVTGALTSFSSNSEIDEALRLAAKCRTNDSLQRAEDFSEARFRRELGSWAPEVFGTASVGKESNVE
jgi:glycosyltransferase involved in cell wall biosynthesis